MDDVKVMTPGGEVVIQDYPNIRRTAIIIPSHIVKVEATADGHTHISWGSPNEALR